MKKIMVVSFVFLLSFLLSGCELFMTDYQKDEIQFQKNMIKNSVIESNINMDLVYYPGQTNEFNMGVDTSFVMDMTTKLALVDVWMLGEQVSLLIDASTDDIQGYLRNQKTLTKLDDTELETLISPSDLDYSDANSFTVGRFSDEMEQNEDGSYWAKFAVSEIEEDDDLYDLFAGIEEEGINIDDMDDKMVLITVDFNDDLTEMTMTYDIDKFDLVVEDYAVPIKMDMELSMKKASIKGVSFDDYSQYPIADPDDCFTVLSVDQSIKGQAFYGSNGYFKIQLSQGSYEVSYVNEDPAMIKIVIYDASKTEMGHDIYGRYVIPSDGVYLINVIGFDQGYFEFKLIKK